MNKSARIIVNYTGLINSLGDHPEKIMAGMLTRAPGDPDQSNGFEKKIDLLNSGLRALRDCELESHVLSSPEHPVGVMLQAFIAGKAAAKAAGPEQSRALEHGGLKVPMDDDDVFNWIAEFLKALPDCIVPHPFLSPPGAPDSVSNDINVALLGDWGSGLYGAPFCSASIARGKYDLVVHLGDIYYVGDKDEVRNHFLDFWPKFQGAQPMSRALMGNHEAYAGGYGYFDLILPRFRQSSSVFALQNDHFLLVGIDTGYGHSAAYDWLRDNGVHIDGFDPGLAHDQVSWLGDMINAAGSRKVVLFSHHQPFSLFENPGPKLQAQLQPLLAAKKIAAWYWGHEHRAVFYDQHASWGVFGRCIGHSGFPYFRDRFTDEPSEVLEDGQHVFRIKAGSGDVPRGHVLDGPNRYVPQTGKQYGPQGYAALELHGPQLQEVLYTPDGTELYRCTLPL
ncbi:metallophosphoesterase family protein [Sorangium sp. So ce1099]|uniref:metallophosphoesterase family protein n=1 Tax=Sorangium sp. So ce1099 TaxID=3133331 RepID=UPI003F60A4F1